MPIEPYPTNPNATPAPTPTTVPHPQVQPIHRPLPDEPLRSPPGPQTAPEIEPHPPLTPST